MREQTLRSNVGRRFSVRLLLLLSTALMLLAGFNIALDPYQAWRPADESTPITYSSRMVKANEIAHRELDFALIGSSRTELGFDPQSPGFASLGRGYNAALPGSNLYEMRRVVEYLLRNDHLDVIYLSLELVMLSDYREAVDDFERSQFALASFEQRVNYTGRILWGAATTGRSFTALWSRLSTGIKPEKRAGQVQYRDGFRLPVPTDGNATKQSAKLRTYYLSSPEAFGGYRLSQQRWQDLLAIAELCAQQQVHLVVFFPPVHAEFLEVVDEAGLWSTYEDIKRASVLDPTLRDLCDHGQLEVWDFSGFRGITTEPLPALSKRPGEMEHYYEISHFRPHIGEMIINRIRGLPVRASEELVAKKLEPTNVEAQLEQLRSDRSRYRTAVGQSLSD